MLLKEVLNVDPEDIMYQELLAPMIAGYDEKELKEALKFRRFALSRSVEICLFKHLGAISEEAQKQAVAGKSIVGAPAKGVYLSDGNATDDARRISERFSDARKDAILSGVKEMESVDDSYSRDVRSGFIFRDEKGDLEAERAAQGRGRNMDPRWAPVEAEKPPLKRKPPRNDAIVLTLDELTLHLDVKAEKEDCERLWGKDDELCAKGRAAGHASQNLMDLSIPEDAVCRTYNRNARGILEDFAAQALPNGEALDPQNPSIKYLQADAKDLKDRVRKYRFSTINLSPERNAKISQAAAANNSRTSQWQYVFFGQTEVVRHIREFSTGFFGEGEGVKSLQRFAVSFFFEECTATKQEDGGDGDGGDGDDSDDAADWQAWRLRFANWILEGKSERAALVTYLRAAKNSPVVRARQLLMLRWEKEEDLRRRGLPFLRVIDGLENGFVFVGDLLLRAARRVEKAFEFCSGIVDGNSSDELFSRPVLFKKARLVLQRCSLPTSADIGRVSNAAHRKFLKELHHVWSQEDPALAVDPVERVQRLIDLEFEMMYHDFLYIGDRVVQGEYVNPLWPVIVENAAYEMMKMDYLHPHVMGARADQQKRVDDFFAWVAVPHYRANKSGGGDSEDPLSPGEDATSNILADGNSFAFVRIEQHSKWRRPDSLEQWVSVRGNKDKEHNFHSVMREITQRLAQCMRMRLFEKELRESQAALQADEEALQRESDVHAEELGKTEEGLFRHLYRTRQLVPFGFREQIAAGPDLVGQTEAELFRDGLLSAEKNGNGRQVMDDLKNAKSRKNLSMTLCRYLL